jgi:hypothetical protein
MRPDSRTASRPNQCGVHDIVTPGTGPKTTAAVVVCAASAAPRAHHVRSRIIIAAAVNAPLEFRLRL